MGWEQRGNNRYYYRKERSGRHVRSVYVGCRDLAALTGILDAALQDDREAKRSAERHQRAAVESIDASIDSLTRLASTLTQAMLIASGFHQHKGQWRRRRA